MKTIALHLILALLVVRGVCGKAGGLPADAIEKADLIVHVRVDDDLDLIPMLREKQLSESNLREADIVFPAKFKDPREYRKVATASCVQVFKGAARQHVIKIRHTNGFACPNVIYRKGREYIVFLQKEVDSDCYVTMNYYAGQFPVDAGEVTNFYLIPEYRYPRDFKLPYERVAAFLKEAVLKAKGPDAALKMWLESPGKVPLKEATHLLPPG